MKIMIRDGTVGTRNEVSGMRNKRGSAVNPGVLDPQTAGGVKVLKQWFSSHGPCRIRVH